MNCDEALDAGREIKRAVSLLFPPGDVVEVRALSDFKTYSGYFKNFDRLAAEALALESAGVNGIYVTLNKVNPVLFSRRADRVKALSKKDATTSDADIVRRNFLPVDIDPIRPSGLSSSDDEHDYALLMAGRVADFLAGLGFSEPVIADSGNGAHLLYRISLPNDGDSGLLVKHCLEVLDALFSDGRAAVDKGNYNASRIWKLYGTTACKGDDTSDRPHRRSGIISAPDNLTAVSKASLVKLSEFIPGRNKKDIPPPAVKGSSGFDLSGWLGSHGISVKSEKSWQGGTLFVLDECPFSSAHKDGAFAVQFANGAVFAGCHHNSCGAGEQRWSELRAMYEKGVKPEKRAVKSDLRAAGVPADSDLHAAALEVLRNGNPLKFMLDTFGKYHIGDRIVAECMVMSVASQSVDNTMGLHVSVSGNSGKGKTHACKSMLKLIPDGFKLSGSVSDKALYYNPELRAGTVFWFDDTALSEDFQEVLKNATSNFDAKIEHMTLTSERKLKVCTIPERCVWWLSKVDDAGDDQVLNRMLTVWIDDSAEQDGKVLEYLRDVQSMFKSQVSDLRDVFICREMWQILKESLVYVRIPYSGRIRFLGFSNRRNPSVLFDLIKCHALLFSMQRTEVEDASGVKSIEADLSDFYAALDVYKKIEGDSGALTSNLSKNEARMLSFFETMEWDYATIKMLQDSLDLSYHQVRRVFHGYSARGVKYPGLLFKCPAVSYVDTVVPEDTEAGTVRKREQRFLFNYEVYRGWINSCSVVLDDDDSGPGDGDLPGCTAGEVFGSLADDDVGGPAGGEVAALHGENTVGVQNPNPDDCGLFMNRSGADALSDGRNTILHSSSGAQHGCLSDISGYDCCISEMSATTDHSTVYSRLFDYRGDLRGELSCTPGVYGGVMLQNGYADLSFNNGAGPYVMPVNIAGCSSDPGYISGRGGGAVCCDAFVSASLTGHSSGGDSGRASSPDEEYNRFRFNSSVQDKNPVMPLPGLFKAGNFTRVYKDLGACHICGKGKVRFRCEDLRVNICDSCMVKIMKGEGWYRGR